MEHYVAFVYMVSMHSDVSKIDVGCGAVLWNEVVYFFSMSKVRYTRVCRIPSDGMNLSVFLMVTLSHIGLFAAWTDGGR
tara:strand:- start:218 stop:454 length:237 start_codon:yes stop_codon:yes gene_type:complete